MEDVGFWRSQLSNVSIFKIINADIVRMVAQNPTSFPDLRQASTIFIYSDYSGEHSGSKYQILSFLIADLSRCQQWEKDRQELRIKYLSNNRRMSFKQLNDKQRQRALKPFLKATNSIPGLVFTVAIDSNIKTLFEGSSPLDLNNPEFDEFKSWKPKVLEKAFRTVHFISFLLAGLSRTNQNLIWITDQDAIAANSNRLKQLTNLFGWVVSSYLTFDLGHIRCGTTQSDNGTMEIEDLAAIPDIIAGALFEQMQLAENDFPNTFWMHRGDFSEKTSSITWWLADVTKPLKRVFCKLDSIPNSDQLNVSWYHFHNQS